MTGVFHPSNLPRRAIVLPVLLLFSLIGNAMNLQEYRTAVAEAVSEIRSAQIVVNDDNLGTAEAASRVDASLTAARAALPPSVNIETPSGSVSATFEWFHTALANYDPGSGQASRISFLEEVEERLSTILWSIDELLYAAEASRTKDEDKQKLAEILSRQEYSKPAEASESTLDRFIRRILDWLFGERQAVNPQPINPNIARVIQIVLIAAIVAIVGFAIFKLAPLLIPSRRRRKRKTKKDRVILGEEIADERTSADLFAEAEELARSGDLRSAIRKGYIAMLCDLSDKNILGLARHKTNRDYLRDLRDKNDIYPAVAGMTESFEVVWYGSRETRADVWEDFRKSYRKVLSIA
jgi:hypothetical protein